MGKEYEAKFLEVDQKLLKEKLIKIGAKKVQDRTKYVRSVFSLCNSKIRGYARVRDEGNGVTMTSKIYNNPDFPDEYEVKISEDFKTGRNFLKSLNLEEMAFQESYREKWSHPKAHEITFDTLPGLPVYMEVDCDTLENLNFLIDELELDKTKMRYGAFDRTYNEYYDIDKDVINNHTPSLTFKNILSELKPKKNKKLLEKLAEIQKDY